MTFFVTTRETRLPTMETSSGGPTSMAPSLDLPSRAHDHEGCHRQQDVGAAGAAFGWRGSWLVRHGLSLILILRNSTRSP